jgi:hypothetical protein
VLAPELAAALFATVKVPPSLMKPASLTPRIVIVITPMSVAVPSDNV